MVPGSTERVSSIIRVNWDADPLRFMCLALAVTGADISAADAPAIETKLSAFSEDEGARGSVGPSNGTTTSDASPSLESLKELKLSLGVW